MQTKRPYQKTPKSRFRGFLPVVVDVETSGTNPSAHALLEVAVVLLEVSPEGIWQKKETLFEHILPFEQAEMDPKALEFNGIDPHQPLRFAVEEKTGLSRLFKPIVAELKKTGCQRAVLVGHNAWFDLLFLKEAAIRSEVKFPFHAFTCFDTATLSALCYGQTVLAKALEKAGIHFDKQEAHSAIYDAEKTAELFCKMVNTWETLLDAKS